jgi:hypothetical protein
VLELHYL